LQIDLSRQKIAAAIVANVNGNDDDDFSDDDNDDDDNDSGDDVSQCARVSGRLEGLVAY
jgi:hypothetical protein